MNRPKVAVYAIALNELSFCERFVNSCAGADLVLVADTGSTDGTPERLRALGAEVHSITIRPWRFDLARDAALALLPPDIDVCISLDLDELLVDGWLEALAATWRPELTRFRYEYTWNFLEDGSPGLVFWADKTHARQGYRWRHPCHETLSYYGQLAERFVDVAGMMVHHRADPSKSRGQYLPLLEQAFQESPDSDRSTFYFGRELYFYQHSERAIEVLQHYLQLSTWAEERSQAMLFIAECQRRLGRTGESQEWLRRAIAECPWRREVWYEAALEQYRRQDWPQAYAAASTALSIVERSRSYLNQAAAWGALPHDLLAIAAYHLGLYAEALHHGQRAIDLEPTNQRLQDNQRFYAERCTPSASSSKRRTKKTAE
jgi:tetratricopeptide (TPR) repeat protein